MVQAAEEADVDYGELDQILEQACAVGLLSESEYDRLTDALASGARSQAELLEEWPTKLQLRESESAEAAAKAVADTVEAARLAAEAEAEAKVAQERLAAEAAAAAAADTVETVRLAVEARPSVPTAPPAALKATVAAAQATAQAAEAQPPHAGRDPRAEERPVPRAGKSAQTEAMKHHWRRGLQGTLQARAEEREKLSRRLLTMAPSEWSAARSAETGSSLVFRSLRPQPPQLPQLRVETAQAIAGWVQGQGLRPPAEEHPEDPRAQFRPVEIPGGAEAAVGSTASATATATAAATAEAVGDSSTASAEAEAEALVSEGHAANKRGDAAAAQRRFDAAYALDGKPSTSLSAANMTLKQGGPRNGAAAAARYQQLLERGDLSPQQREVATRKLLEFRPLENESEC